MLLSDRAASKSHTLATGNGIRHSWALLKSTAWERCGEALRSGPGGQAEEHFPSVPPLSSSSHSFLGLETGGSGMRPLLWVPEHVPPAHIRAPAFSGAQLTHVAPTDYGVPLSHLQA